MKNYNQTGMRSIDAHIWVCKERSGFLGEIITFRNLSVEINELKSKKNLEKICPKGVIICANSGQIAYGNCRINKRKIE